MTKPDEALLYARRQLANTWRKDGAPPKAVAAALAGEFDDVLGLAAHDYRAGAAASEARIKELEAALQRIVNASEPVEKYTHEVAAELEEAIKTAELVLKEPDQ